MARNTIGLALLVPFLPSAIAWAGGSEVGAAGPARSIRFAAHEIDSFPAGYQVAVADVDRDGKPDVVALSTEASRVDAYLNPGWRRVPIATVDRPIDLAPRDLDGDGFPEIVVASGFYFNESARGGEIRWFGREKDGEPWSAHPIGVDPVTHRLRWGDFDGDGKAELVHAPIFGPGSDGARAPKPARLRAFRPPPAAGHGGASADVLPDHDWAPWPIDETLTVLHGLCVKDLDLDGRDEILTASFEGIHLLRLEKVTTGSGSAGIDAWRKTRVARGAEPSSADPGAPRGSSEAQPGRDGRGGPFLAAIEPWHGEMVVVYTPPGPAASPRGAGERVSPAPRAPEAPWERRVIDGGMSEGHALVVVDLDGDGADEIVAGWRGAGGGLVLFDAASDGVGDAPAEGPVRWRRVDVEPRVPVEGLVAADLNGDGRPDLVAAAGRANRLVWYENLGP